MLIDGTGIGVSRDNGVSDSLRTIREGEREEEDRARGAKYEEASTMQQGSSAEMMDAEKQTNEDERDGNPALQLMASQKREAEEDDDGEKERGILYDGEGRDRCLAGRERQRLKQRKSLARRGRSEQGSEKTREGGEEDSGWI